MSAEWKSGGEFLPYHAQASHVAPDYRDGWNACYTAAAERIAALEQTLRDMTADRDSWERQHSQRCDDFNAAHAAKDAAEDALEATRAELRLATATAEEQMIRADEAEAEAAGLRADAERGSEYLRIGQAVQRACAELPPLYNVEIDLERGAGTVYMVDRDGERVFVDSDSEFSSQINAAIDSAIQADKEA